VLVLACRELGCREPPLRSTRHHHGLSTQPAQCRWRATKRMGNVGRRMWARSCSVRAEAAPSGCWTSARRLQRFRFLRRAYG